MAKFKGSYEAEDGYCGGSRPQYFFIDDGEIEDDMTDEDLRELFEREMQDDFEQKVMPAPQNIDKFVEWAKERIAEREAE